MGLHILQVVYPLLSLRCRKQFSMTTNFCLRRFKKYRNKMLCSVHFFIFKFFSVCRKPKERGDDSGHRLEKKYCAR